MSTKVRLKTTYEARRTDENTYDGIVIKGAKMWVRVYDSSRNEGACPTPEQVKEDFKSDPSTFRAV